MRLLVTIAALLWAGSANAQLQPPPQADSTSPTGVSYANGSFNYDAGVDVSIGDGDFPAGLTLHRAYMSSLNPTFSGGFGTPGWAFDLFVRVSNSIVPPPPDLPQNPVNKKFLYSVVWGTKRIGFNGGSTNPTGGPVGTYTAQVAGTGTLVFTGTAAAGNYTFTSADGTVITFLPGSWSADTLTAPDGTTLKFNYGTSSGATLSSVFSNRGYAILFESAPSNYSKACAVNLKDYYVQDGSSCPAGVPTATYTYTTSSLTGAPLLTAVTNAVGSTTQFSYGGYDHLTCITPPGASGCTVSNTYSVCQRTPPATIDPPYMRLADQVLSQTLADGRTVTYSFDANPYCPRSQYDGTTVTETTNGLATRQVTSSPFGIVLSYTDELSRTTTYTASFNKVKSITHPEGDVSSFGYTNGFLSSKTDSAKPGSGLADKSATATYPSSCVPVTCSKPTSVVDPNGGQTDFTYDSTHGGVLTGSAPADTNGVRAVKRYVYSQRFAWIKNAGGGYSQAASPIWVLTEMRTCRTSATVAGACAAGTGDEVVTAYDYGPTTGAVGNNLQLRGIAVIADGRTLRTCYSYDTQGNRISETKPNANLAVCP